MVRPYIVLVFVLFTTSAVWSRIQAAATDIAPCNPTSCGSECASLGVQIGENVTITHQCNKASGLCSCCVLPTCETTCQQRRKKERPRSKEVRSRCNDKGECYCNFIFFEDDSQQSSTPKVAA